MIALINEKEIAENLTKDFYSINFDTYNKLKCYTKYLKNETDITKNEIRNELDELMMEYYTGFVMADWDKTLQQIVNKYTKPINREYKKSKEIKIYKKELEFIKNVGDVGSVIDIEVEKVLFIMLVLGKMGDFQESGLWVNSKSLDIFKMARFKYKQKSDKQKIQREKLIYDLVNCKNGDILSVSTFGKSTGIKLLFADKDGEEVLLIDKDTDLENIVVKYLEWRDKDEYDYCVVCGKEIVNTNGKAIYCKKCAKEIDRKKAQKRMENRKNSICNSLQMAQPCYLQGFVFVGLREKDKDELKS